jgi:GDP-L-fucose synthase
MWALFNYDSCEPLILSVGEEDEISIKELAHHIAKSIEFKGNIIFDETKSDGQYKKTANNNKLKSLTDFKFTNIEEGIKETCEWYITNYKKARK